MIEGFWGVVIGTKTRPDDKIDQDRAERWDEMDEKAHGTIGFMCSKAIQLQLKSKWTSHQMMEHLKKICIPTGWSHKLELVSKVEALSLSKCKNITDFRYQLTRLKDEVQQQKITIEEYIVIKAINSLDRRFESGVTCLVQKTRNAQDGKLPDYEVIFENLLQEEHRIKQRDQQANWTQSNTQSNDQANAARGGNNRGSGRGGRGGARGGGPYRSG